MAPARPRPGSGVQSSARSSSKRSSQKTSSAKSANASRGRSRLKSNSKSRQVVEPAQNEQRNTPRRQAFVNAVEILKIPDDLAPMIKRKRQKRKEKSTVPAVEKLNQNSTSPHTPVQQSPKASKRTEDHDRSRSPSCPTTPGRPNSAAASSAKTRKMSGSKAPSASPSLADAQCKSQSQPPPTSTANHRRRRARGRKRFFYRRKSYKV